MGPEASRGQEFQATVESAEAEKLLPDETAITVARHGGSWLMGRGEGEGLIKEEELPRNIEEIKAKVADLGLDPETYAAIFCSSTKFWSGQRAVQTAGIYRDALLDEYKQIGVDEDHILNFSPEEGGEVRQSSRVGEWNGWDVEELREVLFGGEFPTHRERLDAINNGNLSELSAEVGAETPEDMGENLQKFLRDVGSFSTFWHQANPGKKLQIILVTHGERIRKFKGMFMGGEDFDPKPNQGFILNIDKEGETTVEFEGQTYPVDIDNSPEAIE